MSHPLNRLDARFRLDTSPNLTGDASPLPRPAAGFSSPSAPLTERQVSSKRRDIARLRHDMRLQQAEMQTLIANDIDCTGAATILLRMRTRLARLIAERDALMAALIGTKG
jgi:hypothetical protein